MGSVRLLPLVALAAVCLLLLKIVGFLMSGSGVLTGHSPASAQQKINNTTNNPKQNLQQDKKEKPRSLKEELDLLRKNLSESLVTGSSDKKKPKANEKGISSGPETQSARSEFAILQSLSNRRKQLEERERQLMLQRNLLKAAEKRLEARLAELKSRQGRVAKGVKRQKTSASEQYSKLIQMYSKMKPADAARIFNRLDLEVLVDIVQGMKARTMSSILSAMDPAKAERLTIRIATEGKNDPLNTQSLPKIKSIE